MLILFNRRYRNYSKQFFFSVVTGALLWWQNLGIAQKQYLKVERITVEQGLSQNLIWAITQDHRGFMWFATKDGLNRFDGHRFTVFRYDPSDSTSLSSNLTTALHEGASGKLWIGTGDGSINLFVRETESFVRYVPDAKLVSGVVPALITSITEDASGRLWVLNARHNLFWVDQSRGDFTAISLDSSRPLSDEKNFVYSICKDQQNNLWVGIHEGIMRYDPQDQKFVTVELVHTAKNTLAGENVISLAEARSGGLWIQTSSRRLYKYDLQNNILQEFLLAIQYSHSVGERPGAIYEDNFSNLWLNAHGVILRYDLRQGIHTAINLIPIDPDKKYHTFAYSFYLDRGGVFWVGTLGWGLYRYSPNIDKFLLYQGVLNKFISENALSNLKSFADTDATGLRIDRDTLFQRRVVKDGQGMYWSSSQYVTYRYDPKTRRIWMYQNGPHELHRPLPGAVVRLFDDHRGDVWILTSTGLSRFEMQSGFFSHYQFDTRQGRVIRENELIETPEFISGHRDSTGTIWLGTKTSGLIRFDPASEDIHTYHNDPMDPSSLSHNHVLTIAEDPSEPEKFLWLGTDGGGLNRLEKASGKCERFTEKEGLPNNVVYGILADHKGFLWMSTNKGICRFDPKSRTFRNYDMNDGLQGSEFNRTDYYQAADGRMYFGGTDGFNIFNPDQLEANSHIPQIVITDFRLKNKSVSFRELGSPLKKPISETREIILPYAENMITFEFAALDFAAPVKNQFTYTLEGFDKGWIHSGTSRTATYTNLDPGNYTFRVKGSNNDGVWNELGTSLTLIITPPFWRTWWFYSLVGVSVISSVYFGVRHRVRRLQKEHADQQEFSRRLIESQEAERKRIASELHDSLGQDLIVIKNRATMGTENPERSVQQLKEITDVAAQALDGVRQVAYNLRPFHIDRLGLTKALQVAISRITESSRIRIKHKVDNIDGLFSKEDEIHVFRIVQESMNNIIKHSGASEAIISLLKRDASVKISISDNGKGFEVQESGIRSADAEGLGLKGISERVRILNGTYEINSSRGRGTRLFITIPIAGMRNER